MASAAYFEHLAVVDDRSCVALGARQLGETRSRVELGQRGGDAAKPAVLTLDG